VDIADLSLETLQEFSPDIDATVFEVLTVEGSVASRNHVGGTAPERVRVEIAAARRRIGETL